MERIRFDVSFANMDTVRRGNHGKPWSRDELIILRRLFMLDCDLRALCEKMQRSPAGVLPKLRSLHLIDYSPDTGEYYRREDPTVPTPENPYPETTQEIAMNPDSRKASNIETITRTYINGTDAAGMSDDQIFQRIAQLESQIAHYEAIQNKPHKLLERIAALRADIQTLVAYVDGR